MAGPKSKYVWCLHCERAYERCQARLQHFSHPRFGEAELLSCAYEDCDGDLDFDGRDWKQIRTGREDRYPEHPVWGTVYPQYDSDASTPQPSRGS